MTDYKEKYLKYKNKYLNLKQIAGSNWMKGPSDDMLFGTRPKLTITEFVEKFSEVIRFTSYFTKKPTSTRGTRGSNVQGKYTGPVDKNRLIKGPHKVDINGNFTNNYNNMKYWNPRFPNIYIPLDKDKDCDKKLKDIIKEDKEWTINQKNETLFEISIPYIESIADISPEKSYNFIVQTKKTVNGLELDVNNILDNLKLGGYCIKEQNDCPNGIEGQKNNKNMKQILLLYKKNVKFNTKKGINIVSQAYNWSSNNNGTCDICYAETSMFPKRFNSLTFSAKENFWVCGECIDVVNFYKNEYLIVPDSNEIIENRRALKVIRDKERKRKEEERKRKEEERKRKEEEERKRKEEEEKRKKTQIENKALLLASDIYKIMLKKQSEGIIQLSNNNKKIVVNNFLPNMNSVTFKSNWYYNTYEAWFEFKVNNNNYQTYSQIYGSSPNNFKLKIPLNVNYSKAQISTLFNSPERAALYALGLLFHNKDLNYLTESQFKIFTRIDQDGGNCDCCNKQYRDISENLKNLLFPNNKVWSTKYGEIYICYLCYPLVSAFNPTMFKNEEVSTTNW